MKCSKCRECEMTVEMVGNVEIDRCPTCKGIYLDHGELMEILRNQLGSRADTFQYSATSDAMDEVAAHCYRCDKPMEARHTQDKLRVDMCTKCWGVFLDQGELASLQLNFG